MKKQREIELGDTVRDTVSGYKGVVLAKMTALYEATQYRVHSQEIKVDGDIRGGNWIHAGQLVIIEEKRVVGFVAIEGAKI